MKTVFVLGAAANKELDQNNVMPVGAELAEQIQDQLITEVSGTSLPSESPISRALMTGPQGLSTAHESAMRRIADGITHTESIDQFIDEWGDQESLSEVGKTAIANAILHAESNTRFKAALSDADSATLAMRGIRDSWLGQVFRFANPNERRRDVEQCLRGISFLTFNYDRCLEAALYLFLRYGQNLDEIATEDLMRKIPIMHAYGDLGTLFEFGGTGHDFEQIRPWDILNAAGRIRTFTEHCESDHRARLRLQMTEADRIVFLGFGFHDQNLSLIEPETYCDKRVFGTVLGMRDPAVTHANNYFSALEGNCKLQYKSCSELIDEHRESIFQ